MTLDRDPPRLADAGSEGLRSMLEAARGEAPSAERLDALAERLAPLLGPPVAPGGPSGMGSAPPSANPPPPLPSIAPAASKLAAVALAIAIAGTGAAVVYWGIHVGRSPAPQASVTIPVSSEPVLPAPPPEVVEVAPVASASIEPEPAPPSSAKPRPAAKASATAPEASAPPSDSETEVSLLRRAQEALASSPSQALALAAEHEKRFPAGSLEQEREVIAITALVALGRTAEARTRIERFLAQHPSSAHRRRLENLLAPPRGAAPDHNGASEAPITQ